MSGLSVTARKLLVARTQRLEPDRVASS